MYHGSNPATGKLVANTFAYLHVALVHVLLLKQQIFCVHKLETDAETQVFQLVARPQLTGVCCVNFYSVMT